LAHDLLFCHSPMLRLLHGSAAEAQKPHPLCQEGLQLLVSPRRPRCACIPVGQKAYLGIVVLRGVAHEIYPYVIALDTEPSLSVVCRPCRPTIQGVEGTRVAALGFRHPTHGASRAGARINRTLTQYYRSPTPPLQRIIGIRLIPHNGARCHKLNSTNVALL
jgi:hypothetical protein